MNKYLLLLPLIASIFIVLNFVIQEDLEISSTSLLLHKKKHIHHKK